MFKKIICTPLIWLILIAILVFVAFYLFGFRIVYSPDIEYNWEAIAAVGQWAMLLIAILIPIAAVYFEHRLQESKSDIGDSNMKLLNELKEYKIQSEAKFEMLSEALQMFGDVNRSSKQKSDKEAREDLKEDVLKFINISMRAHTSQVAEHIGVSEIEAWNILQELYMHDGLISSAGTPHKDNLDRNVWLRKRRK